jgi:hypothetical protein
VSTRLENIARILDFVSEGITRAAEQAREVLYASAEATSGTGASGSKRNSFGISGQGHG